MKRIIVFDDTPSGDGCGCCCLGVIVLLILVIGGIAIWPIMINAASDDTKSFLMISGVVILSCVGTTITYYTINREHLGKRGFFAVFGVIYIFTAIVTGIILNFIFSLTDETYDFFYAVVTIFFTVLVTSVPSAVAAAVCKLLKSK